MILKRIANAIQRQDWFTVLIEIAIVVIGLLIGLQINNWNESRSDRANERAFLERMALDVDIARDQLTSFIAQRENRLRSIAKVENMYLGDAEVEVLSELECTQFANMHVITHPPVAVPSITEAFSGGRIDLLSDTAVINALIVVEQSNERLFTAIDSIGLYIPILSQKFPEAINWTRATNKLVDDRDRIFAHEGYKMAAQCHFLETAPTSEFISDVVFGLQTNQWYVTFLNRHLERLDVLANLLDGKPISESAEIEGH